MPYLEKLKMLKEGRGLTNVEIARLSDLPLATITRVFNGSTPNPTFETFTRIAIALGASLDEIAGLKQPDATPIADPIAAPIETTITSYAELLKEKDERIKELKEEKETERKDKYRITCVLVSFVAFILVVLAVDLLKSHFM